MKITECSLVEQQNITEIELKSRLELFRLSQEDLNSRTALKGIVERNLDMMVGIFYENQTDNTEIATLIGDSGTLTRLIAAQKTYIVELISRDVDLAYVENRLRIGLIHKRLGVAPKLYLSAIGYLKGILTRTIEANLNDQVYAKSMVSVIHRLIDFDISFVFDAYIRSMMTELEAERTRSERHIGDLENLIHERTHNLQQVSRLDPLTNLFNKRTFESTSSTALESVQIKNEPISLVYIDIDDFKHCNDELGHDEGDAILVLVADCIRSASRNVDYCYRFGGDEFVIIMPSCSKDLVLKHFVPRLTNEILSVRSDVSLSIGIAQSGPDDYLSIKDTLRLADKDMYIHKRNIKRKCHDDEEQVVAMRSSNSK